MQLITFILPCYGSENTVASVIAEIIETVGQKPDYDYEIIAVNDCSPDNVWSVLTGISRSDSKVRLIDFAKNSNRPGAVMAGLRHASGDIVIVMDDDGQCPMPELWKLLEPLDNGYDVSIADYPERKQNVFKNFGTAVNKKMTEVIIGRPKNLQFTNFMAMKSYIAKELTNYTNPYPYLTGLLLRTTQRIKNVPMDERSRICGNTNFTMRKMLNLWMNGFTAFSIKPLRISTVLGLICAFFGFAFGIFIIVRKLVCPDNILMGYSSLMAALLFVGGMIMVMLGLIGEYIGRIYISINNSPQYVIREKVNFNTDNTSGDGK